MEEKKVMADMQGMFANILSRVENGERFSISFEKRTLRVGGKAVDLSDFRPAPASEGSVMSTIEQLYRGYKHSVPSERSESHRRLYFQALPESELSDEDMAYGLPREYARCRLELYVLLMILGGNLRWKEEWGSWFWQSASERSLVILRQWIDP